MCERDEWVCMCFICLSFNLWAYTWKMYGAAAFSHRYDCVMAFSSQLVQQKKIEIKQLMFSDNLFFKQTNTFCQKSSTPIVQ